jgi:molybdopterin synthase catalytic subunit
MTADDNPKTAELSKRQRLLELFKQEKPVWKDQDHPELQAGAAEWVRKMRAEAETRFERIQRHRDHD